jgi:hypothetical protein
MAENVDEELLRRHAVGDPDAFVVYYRRNLPRVLSTSILGYALTIADDREQGVFQRLRVTPAPTWAIMISRLTAQALANLSIGQAPVGLMKSADSVNAAARAVVVGLILLAAFVQRGSLGIIGEAIARWSPVGAVMTLFAAVTFEVDAVDAATRTGLWCDHRRRHQTADQAG